MKDIRNSKLNPGLGIFDRVVSILEEARGNVVRAVNSSMVMAYWLISREIVQELQAGESRAGCGNQVIEELSSCLFPRRPCGISVSSIRSMPTVSRFSPRQEENSIPLKFVTRRVAN